MKWIHQTAGLTVANCQTGCQTLADAIGFGNPSLSHVFVMPRGYVREISYSPRNKCGLRRSHQQGPATASGAGGPWAAAGLIAQPEKRQYLPAVRAGDGKVVHLTASTRQPKRWETQVRFEKPHDKLREWGSRERDEVHESKEEVSRSPVSPQLSHQQSLVPRRRSIQALEQLRSDLLSNPTSAPARRYRGSTSVWDTIHSNANQQCVKMRRILEAESHSHSAPSIENLLREERPPAEDPSRPLYLTAVVLLYISPCNPLNMEHILMLRRARQAVEAFYRVVVAGAVVIPWSSTALAKHFESERPAVQLPFDFRMSIAQSVIEQAEQDWILMDNCQEGCLANAPGKLLDYFSEYTRSRLYDPGYDTKVLEVHDEDTLWSLHPRQMDGSHRVPFDPYGKVPDVSPFAVVKEVKYVLVECPKQVQCRELLRRTIWLICRGEEMTSAMDILRRLLGEPGAELLQRWAKGRARQAVQAVAPR